MAHDPTAYYLVLTEDAVAKEAAQVTPPAQELAPVVVQVPAAPPGDTATPLRAEIAAPILDRVFEHVPPTPMPQDSAGDLPSRAKPAGDDENLAALALVWSGAWAIAEHIEEINRAVQEEETEEEEEQEPEEPS